jgi:hypothetical protein
MPAPAGEPAFSDQLEQWLTGSSDKTLGSLLDVFGKRAFATMFVILLAPSALPLPTGGATNVFEVVAMLLALQLVANREQLWLPQRWRRVSLAGTSQERFIRALMRLVRWLERSSRPRFESLFGHRYSNVVFGLLVIGGTLGAFLAPPFSGLDTLPLMAVVLVSLGVILEDIVVVVVEVVLGVAGVVLEVLLWSVAVDTVGDLF